MPPGPKEYTDEFLAKWELLRRQPPEVQAAEVDRYNRFAKVTRENYDPDAPLAADEHGTTRVSLAPSQPDKLPRERIQGAWEPGKNPYAPVPVLGTVITRQRGNQLVDQHERLHADVFLDPELNPKRPDISPERALQRARIAKTFYELSPRDRELFRVYARMRHGTGTGRDKELDVAHDEVRAYPAQTMLPHHFMQQHMLKYPVKP